eukprot:c9795_g2_i1 orf=106-420(+)
MAHSSEFFSMQSDPVFSIEALRASFETSYERRAAQRDFISSRAVLFMPSQKRLLGKAMEFDVGTQRDANEHRTTDKWKLPVMALEWWCALCVDAYADLQGQCFL